MKYITHIGVVGAGAMGRGIAQLAVQSGLTVTLLDQMPAALEQAREQIHA